MQIKEHEMKEKLRALRIECGITQKELAEKIRRALFHRINCSLQMRRYITGTEHALATFCTDFSSVSYRPVNEREQVAVPVA